ncbi:endonuclease NucS [[Eubacterium] cellulosolvens]
MKKFPKNDFSKFSFIEKPNLNEAKYFLLQSFRRKDFLIIVGNCRCEYSGRASSSLDWGDRIVLMKGDGSVQVHRPVGYEPVNWQPPSCIFSIFLEDSSLKIRSNRPKPKEILDIFFRELEYIISGRPVDDANFNLYVSEEQMRDALVSNPSILEEGLSVIDFERKVEPGFIDFYGKDSLGRIVIVELKRASAGKEAVLQLKRYLDEVKKKNSVPVRGILAAPRLKSGVQSLLISLDMEFKKLTPEKCANVLQKNKVTKISEFFDKG